MLQVPISYNCKLNIFCVNLGVTMSWHLTTLWYSTMYWYISPVTRWDGYWLSAHPCVFKSVHSTPFPWKSYRETELPTLMVKCQPTVHEGQELETEQRSQHTTLPTYIHQMKHMLFSHTETEQLYRIILNQEWIKQKCGSAEKPSLWIFHNLNLSKQTIELAFNSEVSELSLMLFEH